MKVRDDWRARSAISWASQEVRFGVSPRRSGSTRELGGKTLSVRITEAGDIEEKADSFPVVASLVAGNLTHDPLGDRERQAEGFDVVLIGKRDRIRPVAEVQAAHRGRQHVRPPGVDQNVCDHTVQCAQPFQQQTKRRNVVLVACVSQTGRAPGTLQHQSQLAAARFDTKLGNELDLVIVEDSHR
jgi:hypothetical protein